MANQTLFEAWEWYAPEDGQHWSRLGQKIPELKALGIDRMWLPPGCKAGWKGSNGYDVYDLYDLGEFDQKGHKRTKWGDKEALINMARLAHEAKIGLLWDAVLNHKSAADYTEKCSAVIVDKNDRLKDISAVHEVEVWTGYDFPGRKGKYSTFKYHWHHFTGTDWEAALKTNDKLYKFVGPNKPGWAPDVDDSFGNSDYLMGNDLDYSQQEVRDDIHAWGEWIVKEVGLSGFRLDAVKHFSHQFLKEWIQRLDCKFPGQRLFHVGEYWRDDIKYLAPVIEMMEGRLSLFDVPLACNMSKIAACAPKADLREIFDGTLSKHYPSQAVTFVINHDTQARYERDHEVDPIPYWFVPLAYALILLRANTGYPCVFYGDLYGISGQRPQPPQPLLPRLIMARKLYAYGEMRDYCHSATTIAFTRLGDAQQSNGAGLAVIINIGSTFATQEMHLGEHCSGQAWTDILHPTQSPVVIDKRGCGVFTVGAKNVGVWVHERAANRQELEAFAV